MDFFRKIKFFIKNIIYYFPMLWNDRDWDSHYLYVYLRYKLIRMEKFYRYDAIFIGMEKVADDIKHCIYGLNRLIEDEYHENVFKHHDRKWGNIKLDFENTKNKEFQKCLLTRNKVITANDEIQERKEFSLLSYKESMLRKQDLNYIFKIMERKSLSWWN